MVVGVTLALGFAARAEMMGSATTVEIGTGTFATGTAGGADAAGTAAPTESR